MEMGVYQGFVLSWLLFIILLEDLSIEFMGAAVCRRPDDFYVWVFIHFIHVLVV